jgi:opacity protein-like surface antigen
MKSKSLFQILSISTLTLTAALLAAPVAAQTAQVQAGDWEVGFGLGGTKLDSDLSDDSGTRGEIRGGYFFTDMFELEAQAQRSDAYFDSTFDTAALNAVFNFNFNSNRAGLAVPYVLIGAGGAKLDDFDWDFLPGEDDDADGGEGLAYQAALGTRLFFRENGTVAARLEISSFWEDTLDEIHRHTSYTAGLVWRIR